MNRKSIRAVLVGLVFIIGVTTLVDIGLHAMGVFPASDQPLDNALSALATAYRVVIGVAGAWLTAWLAPAKPMKHALVLGAVGVFLAAVGVVVTWNMGLGPRWYPILLVVLALPQSWLGAKVHGAAHDRKIIN